MYTLIVFFVLTCCGVSESVSDVVFLRSRSIKRSKFEQWRLSSFDNGKYSIKKLF